jgi:LmbE family N-acetylglucosaminyl deacetylase
MGRVGKVSRSDLASEYGYCLMLLLGPQQPLNRLLVIGAHSDDIEIGCGGTLLRLLRDYPDVEVTWMVLSAHGDRADEARSSADALLSSVRCRILIHSFRDGFLPYEGAAVKDHFEELKALPAPDLVFTHYGRDAHQDHRLVSELAWNTFRDHMILEFEIPKYDGDLGAPNFFVRLDEAHVQAKVAHLQRHFPSQAGRRWFTEDLFRGLLRVRGMECNAPSGYAEGFYSRKAVL